MFKAEQISSSNGSKKGAATLRRGLFHRLFIMLATLATALNLLVPLTHNAFASAVGEDGYLEICTQNGIQKIDAGILLGDDDNTASNDGGFCDACPDCPLCWVGGAAALQDGNFGYPELAEARQNTPSPAALHLTLAGANWLRPGLRAPPSFT